jgi:hypothetical protein
MKYNLKIIKLLNSGLINSGLMEELLLKKNLIEYQHLDLSRMAFD